MGGCNLREVGVFHFYQMNHSRTQITKNSKDIGNTNFKGMGNTFLMEEVEPMPWKGVIGAAQHPQLTFSSPPCSTTPKRLCLARFGNVVASAIKVKRPAFNNWTLKLRDSGKPSASHALKA